MKWRVAVLLVVVVAASAGEARAEVNVGDSVEWLSTAAARVVVGKVVSLRAAVPGAEGKNRGLTLLTVQVAETIRGAPAAERLCVGVRDVAVPEYEQHRRDGTELLFFLGTSIQATSFEGRVCNHWPLRGGDARPYVVPLARPGTRMLAAGTFKVLKQRAEILALSRDTVRRLTAAARNPKAKPPRRFLVEVPPDSEVYKVLYSGSACYLHVPDVLFPTAKEKLGR